MNLSETFVCIIYIVDIITHFNNGNMRIRDQFLSFSTKCYYLSVRYQWCRAQIRIRHTRLSVSPITGYDSITMTMMPCAKSHNQRISMRRFAISHAIKIRSKIYERSRIWISSEHSYIIPLCTYMCIQNICTHVYIICITIFA